MPRQRAGGGEMNDTTKLTGVMICAINERVLDALRAVGLSQSKAQQFVMDKGWQRANKQIVSEKVKQLAKGKRNGNK
jgi:hypothetical protein